MGHNAGQITAPVNTDDVSAVLGVASHDVATLCTSDKINPAAIYRPRYSKYNPALQLNAAGFAEIAGNISQKPPQGIWDCPNLGIWVPELAINNLTPSNYSNIHSYARNTWFVPIPDNDGTESFKILDHFVGYNHNAKFKDPIIQASVTKKDNTTNTIKIQFSTPSPVNQPGVISVGNMFGGTGWYFGAVVFRGTNSEGIMQNDAMIILGSGTAIRADESTTVTITKDDAPSNASTTTYYYRVVPFVCNIANVSNSNYTSGSNTKFYNIHMSDDYAGMYTLKVGESATGGGVKNYYFAWTESGITNDKFPMPNDKSVPITPSTYHPGIVATINTRPSGLGTDPLKDMFSRVDFHFSFYVSGVHNLITYTWRKSGALPDDNVLTRETSKDNVGGFEDYLFFSVADGATNILNKVSDPSEIELTADLYYANYNQVDYGLWGTFIPD